MNKINQQFNNNTNINLVSPFDGIEKTRSFPEYMSELAIQLCRYSPDIKTTLVVNKDGDDISVYVTMNN